MAHMLFCYRCFEKFPPFLVKFRCENHRNSRFRTSCGLEEDRVTKRMDHHVFQLHGLMSEISSLIKSPIGCKCDKCNYISKKRICPYCHQPLLYETGKIDEHIIAIIGEPGSGKSHYLTVLIERCLKSFVGNDLNFSLEIADDETNEIFNNYRESLFENRTEIPPNKKERGAKEVMLFRLNFTSINPLTKRKTIKPIILTFYDISGELLNSQEEVSKTARYLQHSSGIINLVNPLHLREIAAKLGDSSKIPVVPPDEMMSNVIKEIRKDKNIRPGEQIKIPLAICFSQSDRIRDGKDSLGFDSRLFRHHWHKGKFDSDDFHFVNAEIQDKFKQLGGAASNLARSANQFESKGFFASSALGRSPDKITKIIKDIDPIRLEDPFLWILSEIGTISKTRRQK